MYPVVKSKKFFFLNEKSAWLSAFIGNLITVPLVFFLKKKIFISPNLISIIGGFIFFASAINFYFFPNYNYLCSIGFFISYLLDSTDGKLARIRGMKNKSGAILDSTIDLLCHSVGLLIVCLALNKHVGSHTPLIILLPYVAFLTYAHIRDLKLILFKKKKQNF